MKKRKPARSRRTITYLGALIVFVTFVFREVVQDKAKNDLSTIDSQRSSFLERLEIISAETETLLANGSMTIPPGRTLQEQAQSRFNMLVVRMSIVAKTIVVTREMAEDIDIGRPLLEHFESLGRDVVGIKDDLSPYFNDPTHHRLNSKILNEIEKKINQKEDETGELKREVKMFTDSRRSQAEEGIASINYYSFVLFGLGWAVNLYGHSLPDDKNEDETNEDIIDQITDIVA